MENRMYGNNKVFPGNVDSAIDTQREKYTGFDPLMTIGDSMSIFKIKITYLKITERDGSIGWEELQDELANTLAQIMGDDEFIAWNDSTD